MRSAINYQNRQSLVEYINALTSVSDWDLLLWTFPELKEKYRQALVALHRELVPNYISVQDIYSKLWELFKEIALNANQYQIKINLDGKLSEFCSGVKKPLTTYDILYEIKNFDYYYKKIFNIQEISEKVNLHFFHKERKIDH